ncbi:putative heat repeat containing protein [Diaporthe ampelina]|uniref:Putative heat repeat containing protein n=1 Tax=Diaporthe ampelina TaxID=1214573 RepID=A0A0G2FX40_9PEZI|nr:putative heat repeat containing protein [Diaporthe ampelina]
MAERITDEQVEALQNILRSDASVDAKVAQVTAVKTGIKHHNVPDTCVAQLFEALRTASSNQHGVLANAGLTSLNHLLTRLSRQEPKYIIRETKTTLPLLVDRMGDQKEKFRSLAVQSIATMYKVVPADVERHVRNFAMAGKNSKAKEASMQWLLQMHREQGLQFRTYVPRLMELLEDADPSVRDTAKTTVIELFRDAPGTAKADLKKQLENFRVRPAIKQAIVKELVPRSTTPAPDESGPADLPRPASRPNLAASVSSMSTFSDRPITPMPDTRAETVEPSYLNTTRELDDMFTQMHGYFDGRESEHNWMLREQSINKLRRLMAGNAVSDYHDPFLAGLRSLLDGIIKAITSLRTSLSKEGCALVQDIAINYGSGMDPMVELLMQTFVKVSAATKKIASQQANVCIDTIIGRVTYTNRIMQHVAGACTDKNVQPRLYATEWLKTLLKKEAHHKSHVEHNGGLDLIEKSIKKGLNDANPGVREKMRSTFWTFYGIWPTRAEALMDTLEPTTQKALERDPNNPNAPKKVEPVVRPGLGLSRSTMGAKPSLRETMMAQKKALATKNLPTMGTTPKRTVAKARPAHKPTATVLEEKPVNEDAANLVARQNGDGPAEPDISPDKARQHARLIESALTKIKAMSLDVHGFRKLQGILRDNKAPLSDEKFEALLLGLFDYLEDPQSNLTPEKVQDVKAQNLATIKLLLKKYRDHFQPHISKGLESLMSARAVYDARTHIVSGLELLADELVSLGDAQEIATVLTRRMTDTPVDKASGWRSLSMGLHVLKEMVDAKAEYVPTDQELGSMAALCTRCLESSESGVRMDAVQLCVALQGRVGDARFWDVMKDVKDDPKSLITYYIVKRQREKEAANGVV